MRNILVWLISAMTLLGCSEKRQEQMLFKKGVTKTFIWNALKSRNDFELQIEPLNNIHMIHQPNKEDYKVILNYGDDLCVTDSQGLSLNIKNISLNYYVLNNVSVVASAFLGRAQSNINSVELFELFQKISKNHKLSLYSCKVGVSNIIDTNINSKKIFMQYNRWSLQVTLRNKEAKCLMQFRNDRLLESCQLKEVMII